ncbi:glycosyltransferase [Ruminococcus sp. Marseille-P328]|uniref:glycosyltransferase n=1 Tax=Ruminococcus sp. Marseille-P328 TaxID=1816688 RepID=UPI0035619725
MCTNRKINVLYLIHGLNMGGAETIVKDYALLLDKCKYNVTVLCYQHYYDSRYEEMLKDNGIKVVYVCDYMPFYRKKGIFYKGINHFQRYLLIKKYIRKIKPDILHIHLTLGDMVKFAKPAKNTVLFYTQHFNISRLLQNQKEIKNIKWLIQHYQFCMIALNETMKCELEELFNIHNVQVVNNGIDVSRYRNEIDKSKLRENIGIPKNCTLMVHVGRLTKIKNQEFIVNVFESLKYIKNNVFLLFIGSGEDKDKIQNLLNDKNLSNDCIILSNRVDVPELLMMSDIGIFPSLSEGLGIAAIEMQMAGLQVFASTNVPKETQISNLIHYLDLQIGADKWAETINHAIKSQNKNQIEYYDIDNWNIENNVRQIEKLYEEYTCNVENK